MRGAGEHRCLPAARERNGQLSCDEFPCDEDMLKKRRACFVNACKKADRHKPMGLKNAMRRNENAVSSGRSIGDYDLESDRDIEELLMKGGVHSRG